MNKAKAFFERARNHLPNMIVNEADISYEAYEKLKETCSVKKIKEYIDVLDTEWN